MDAAFATAPFPSLTSPEMLRAIRAGHEKAEVMKAELSRRLKAQQGDMSVMTPGERLRFIKTGKAR